MPTELPSQQRLRELLTYNPESGQLVWTDKATPSRAGKAAFTQAHARGYRVGRIDGVPYLAHRIIWRWMTGETPVTIDHINRVTSDNSWSNLRSVSMRENNLNRGFQKNNISGTVGVTWCALTRRWYAYIKVNRKNISLGRFDLKDDAIRARRAAEIEHGYPSLAA